MSSPDLLVFETHPIQYRAPVYQELQKLCPERFEVVFASDFSVRGYRDAEFLSAFAWDVPLLSGYTNTVLHNDGPGGIESWGGMRARGVFALVKERKPRAILLHSFGHAFCWAVYWAAMANRIPLWIRMETQDEAVHRGRLKSAFRSLFYWLAYRNVAKAFYIGSLNREHLHRHGVGDTRLLPALYCTADPISKMDDAIKSQIRRNLRDALGIPANHYVVAFFGKFIAKKDPALVLRALEQAVSPFAVPITVLMVGAGDLEDALRDLAARLERKSGIRTVFPGFINQSKLSDYYLASDTVVLPSHRAGETWGLVINEALQAGCCAVVSEAVGCAKDFGALERVRVISVGDERQLCDAIQELVSYPRDFAWASSSMRAYSIDAVANTYAAAISDLREH